MLHSLTAGVAAPGAAIPADLVALLTTPAPPPRAHAALWVFEGVSALLLQVLGSNEAFAGVSRGLGQGIGSKMGGDGANVSQVLQSGAINNLASAVRARPERSQRPPNAR